MDLRTIPRNSLSSGYMHWSKSSGLIKCLEVVLIHYKQNVVDTTRLMFSHDHTWLCLSLSIAGIKRFMFFITKFTLSLSTTICISVSDHNEQRLSMWRIRCSHRGRVHSKHTTNTTQQILSLFIHRYGLSWLYPNKMKKSDTLL